MLLGDHDQVYIVYDNISISNRGQLIIGSGFATFGLFLLWLSDLFSYLWMCFTLFQLSLSAGILVGLTLRAKKKDVKTG